MLLQVHGINLRGDAAYGLIATIGDPGAPAGVFKKMVFRGHLLALHKAKRGNPGRVRCINLFRQGQKLAHLPSVCDYLHRYWRGVIVIFCHAGALHPKKGRKYNVELAP